MMRSAIAVALLVAIGSSAHAQPPPALPSPPEPMLMPGPPIIYYKSGNVVVGADGFYPYDTGDFLLGGTAGLRRHGGYFTMSVPNAGGYYGGMSLAPQSSSRHKLFHRR